MYCVEHTILHPETTPKKITKNARRIAETTSLNLLYADIVLGYPQPTSKTRTPFRKPTQIQTNLLLTRVS